MPELSAGLVTGLGLLVVLVLRSSRLFKGPSDSSPETVPGQLSDDGQIAAGTKPNTGAAPR